MSDIVLHKKEFECPDHKGQVDHNLRSAIQIALSFGFEPQELLEMFFDELKAERISHDCKF